MSDETRGAPWDEAEIVVVGAGPSGSVTAAMLAELGHEVLILDKDEFPREKPCGDGLMHPAVAVSERLGLNDLLDSSLAIEASRIVVTHRKQTETSLATRSMPLPRCITRNDFDAALLDAARERGARFLQCRVEGLEGDVGSRRLLAVSGEDSLAIGAGTIVAADGATSRLRRVIAGASPSRAMAYAVRQYFRSEKPLDPVFEGYLPLELEGQVLAGYGWVFPVSEEVANIGVGVFRDAHRLPPLTRVLSAFIEELQIKMRFRFGELEVLSEPHGSPVGIRSPVEVSDLPDLVLVGDAAGMTHALTGEGIPFSMRGGEAVARAVHARSKKGRGKRPATYGASLWRSFPQLGIDVAGLCRLGTLELNRGSNSGLKVSVGEPFLAIVKRLQRESAYDTDAEGTPAWSALDAYSPELARCLERANEALLGRLVNQMPYVTEMTHRFVRAHLGPMYAAIAICTASDSDCPPSEAVLEAAIASETVGVLPGLLTMLVDRADSKLLRANNAIAVLTGDFAATCALGASARLGAVAVKALALACQRGCDGGMRDAAARFAPDRSAESWFRAAEETAGSAAVLATQLGVIVAEGGDRDPAGELRRYGVEIGTAIRLAEEIADLTLGDEMHPGREGEDLRRGIYPLPLLYALEVDATMPQLLTRHSAEGGSPLAIIDAVRECGALDRAMEECSRRAEAARSAANALLGSSGEALAALAAVPPDFAASRVALAGVA